VEKDFYIKTQKSPDLSGLFLCAYLLASARIIYIIMKISAEGLYDAI
jgi:hypothetical protein